MTDTLVERVAKAIGSERDTRRYFSRRAMDKSCYEVVNDLDPDGPITDSSFQVISTWPNGDAAEIEVWRLTNRQYAEAALKAQDSRMAELREAMIYAAETTNDKHTARKLFEALEDKTLSNGGI